MKTVLTIQTRITAQTVLASTLLRLTAADMEEAVKRELAENPALELAEPSSIRSRPAVERLSRFGDGTGWEGTDRGGSATAWEGDDQDPSTAWPPPNRLLSTCSVRPSYPCRLLISMS